MINNTYGKLIFRKFLGDGSMGKHDSHTDSEMYKQMEGRRVAGPLGANLGMDKQARKERPIARGVMDYFPLALAAVANVSFVGNEQHNPGEEMHWAKHKSTDHADCIARHLIERGTVDDDGLRHTAKVAWRALALLQIELEGAPVMGFEEQEAQMINSIRQPKQCETQRNIDQGRLVKLGCPDSVARQIVGGITYANWPIPGEMPYVYIAGPMRHIKDFNFPAFDAARNEWVARGVNVISPADIDRAAGDAQSSDQATFAFRDFYSIYFLKKLANPNNAVVFLDGWEKSTGAFGEFGLARWLGLQLVGARGPMRNMSFVKLTDAIMDTLVKQ